MKNYRFWQYIKSKLQIDDDVILLLVGGHEGSSPGKKGFKMCLRQNGEVYGTIGGGIMEANMLVKAKSMFNNSNKSQLLIQVHNKKAESSEQSGLICAGRQWIILYKISRNEIEVINSIIKNYDLLNPMELKINSSSMSLSLPQNNQEYKFANDQNWLYIERIGDPYVVHVFGAGHVGNAIVRVLRTLNFYIFQYDNRENVVGLDSEEYANQKIIGSFMESADKIKTGPKVYVVVTTYSFDTDYQVLMNVLSKRVNYIGLMGSKSKIAKIFQMLRDDGYSRDLIDLIKAPIGLDISDGSVEEIAISVASEIIEIKNNPTLGIYDIDV